MREIVIEAAPEESLPALVDTFCAAFADDPGLSWVWPDRADRLERLPHFFAAIVGGTAAHGLALRSPGNEAVSLWRLPGRIHPGQAEVQDQLPHLAKAFVTGSERSRLMGETLKPHQPEGNDWWYLQFIGARPDVHGQGFGGAAVRAGLTRAKTAGQKVHVEVMNPDNLGYYLHLGFEVTAEFDIPDDGPHVWAMIARP